MIKPNIKPANIKPEMRKAVLMFFVLALIFSFASLATSESITEYREVVFYPNATQDILKDWFVVVFESEPLKYSVEIAYRNETLGTPSLVGDNMTLSSDLPAKNFNLSILAEQNGNRIVYVVENNYFYEVEMNISIPVFDGFSDCERCKISDDEIKINLTIPPQSSESFTIFVSKSFTIPDSDVNFKVKSQADVKYDLPLGFMIYKYNADGKWFVTFEIKNENGKAVNVTLIGWADINGSRIDLLNKTTYMKPNESLKINREIVSSDPPTFYLKVNGSVTEKKEVSVIPVKKVEERYVVGYGILKGFSGTVTEVSPPTSPERTPTIQPTPTSSPSPSPSPPLTPSPSPSPPLTPSPTPTPTITEIPEVVRKVAPVVAIPTTYLLMFSLIITPLMSLRGVVVDRESLTPENFAMIKTIGKKIYISPSTPLKGCHIVNVDKALVDSLRTTYGISLSEAETIAIALTLRRPVFTSNRKLFETALRVGCLAYLIRSG